MVNPASDGLEGCEAKNHQADDGVGIGPDIEILLGFEGEPNAHASGGDIDAICEDLAEDVQFEHDGMVDIEAQKDAAEGKEKGPGCCCHDSMSDQDAMHLEER